MRVALHRFLFQVESIENNIDLRDNLVNFGRETLGLAGPATAELHRMVRSIRESGLQPVLNGSILLLAAATEQFVKDLMIAYLARLPRIVPVYRDLPGDVRAANEQQTGEVLKDGHPEIGPSDVDRFVRNLGDCLAGVTPYTLNGEAIALNDRNLDARRLRLMMRRLGIDSIWGLIGNTRPLKEWSGQNRPNVAESRAQALLNEFVDNRNHIAHRVGNVEPGPDVVRAYISLWCALARSLVEGLGIFWGFYSDAILHKFGPV
jgi:hypothetical protein